MEPKETIWQDEKLIQILTDGGVVVMPTDTVYGIVCQANNRIAVSRVYAIRKRDTEKPCIILISDIKDLEKFEMELVEVQRVELLKLWSLDFIGDKSEAVSVVLDCPNEEFSYLHRGTDSLAFRLPKEVGLQTLLKQTGPLIAPSANTEGSSVAKNIEEAEMYFSDSIDMYVDGGEIVSIPSKIIKLDKDGTITILRD